MSVQQSPGRTLPVTFGTVTASGLLENEGIQYGIWEGTGVPCIESKDQVCKGG